jgi:hypothetical protein
LNGRKGLKAALADVVIRLVFGFVPSIADAYFLTAVIAINYIFPPYIVLPKLIAKRQPTRPQIIVPCEELNLFGSRNENVDKGVYLIRLLGLFSDFSNDKVVGYL